MGNTSSTEQGDNGGDSALAMSALSLRRARCDATLAALSHMMLCEVRHHTTPGTGSVRLPPLPPMMAHLLNVRLDVPTASSAFADREVGEVVDDVPHVRTRDEAPSLLTEPNWRRAASMDLTVGVDFVVHLAPQLRRLDVQVPYYVEKQPLASHLNEALEELAVLAHYDVDLDFPTDRTVLPKALKRLHLSRIDLYALHNGLHAFFDTVKELQLHSCSRLYDVSALQNALSLEKLVIDRCDVVSTTALHGIERLPSLTDVTLSWCCGVTNVNFFASSLSLTRLSVQGSRVPFAGIRGLGESRSLRSLNLSSCFAVSSVDDLSVSTTLTELRVDNTEVASIARVCESVSTLRRIALTRLSDADVAVLSARSAIQIDAKPTTAATLAQLAKVGAAVRTVAAHDTPFFPLHTAIGGVAACVGLQELSLFELKASVDVSDLQRLPHLSQLTLTGDGKPATKVCGTLRRAAALQTLVMEQFASVAEDLIDSLAGLPCLTRVRCSGVKGLVDARPLRRCPALRSLQLRHCGVTTSGIKGLEKIDSLQLLDLTGCTGVTDVERLKRASSLLRLSLMGTGVRDTESTCADVLRTVAKRNLLRCF